jgi:hypothetical protein
VNEVYRASFGPLLTRLMRDDLLTLKASFTTGTVRWLEPERLPSERRTNEERFSNSIAAR